MQLKFITKGISGPCLQKTFPKIIVAFVNFFGRLDIKLHQPRTYFICLALSNTIASDEPGGNRIRVINIKAQQSAFSIAMALLKALFWALMFGVSMKIPLRAFHLFVSVIALGRKLHGQQ